MAAVLASPSRSPDELDRVFHALSDRTRRAILSRLAGEPATVTDLAEPFAMSLPAVSKHLRVLENAGLLTRTAEGRRRRCAIHAVALANAVDWLAPYRTFWAGQFEALDRYLVPSPRPTRRRRRQTQAVARRRSR